MTPKACALVAAWFSGDPVRIQVRATGSIVRTPQARAGS
jgi:hypothetical protein